MKTKKKNELIIIILALMLSFLLMILWNPKVAKGQSRLATLTGVAAALGEAAESVSKMVDSFAHLIRTATRGYDAASARATYSRLRDLSARASILIAEQQISVIQGIDAYIEESSNPAVRSLLWSSLTTKFRSILLEINSLLADVQAERSDFVLETTYLDMIRTLQTRGVILEELLYMPPPTSPEELKELRQIRDNYELLIINLRRATIELNEYLKMLGPAR